jgi:hypothetical protein
VFVALAANLFVPIHVFMYGKWSLCRVFRYNHMPLSHHASPQTGMWVLYDDRAD